MSPTDNEHSKQIWKMKVPKKAKRSFGCSFAANYIFCWKFSKKYGKSLEFHFQQVFSKWKSREKACNSSGFMNFFESASMCCNCTTCTNPNQNQISNIDHRMCWRATPQNNIDVLDSNIAVDHYYEPNLVDKNSCRVMSDDGRQAFP